MKKIHQHKILILDFGSQYAQLIARRVRECGVYCELMPFDVASQKIVDFQAQGIILSGGPESVHDAVDFRIPDCVFSLGVPVLGICYGMQAMALQLGGQVSAGESGEFGATTVTFHQGSALFAALDTETLSVWMSHGDKVSALPAGFVCVASSTHAPIAVMADESRDYYGIQFHPEVTHSDYGREVFGHFVQDICGCDSLWVPKNIVEEAIASIRQQVGDDHVILGLSGGVDSSVVAVLLNQAIGKQLTCIFVDTGLLRLNEAEQVMQMFAEHRSIHVICVDAKVTYFKALKGVVDPEEKRQIIGHLFVKIFEQEAEKIGHAKWLAQGTIYSDVIESAATGHGKAHVIKSHHNVGGLPDNMQLKLLEPLRELFKDEVRQIGLTLGLPPSVVYRHPFPGPGLGVRVLGEVKAQYVAMLQKADAIFIQTLRDFNYYDQVSQAFAVFLPVKSVGVIGDARQYDYVICLRAVETIDFMSAHWARLPYELLDQVAHDIVNQVSGVSRVTYDISGKPPATIEWE